MGVTTARLSNDGDQRGCCLLVCPSACLHQPLLTTPLPSTSTTLTAAAQGTLKLMEGTLQWRHLAPTAPDTLPCYPFCDTDPFVLDACPHVYFVGNQVWREGGWGWVKLDGVGDSLAFWVVVWWWGGVGGVGRLVLPACLPIVEGRWLSSIPPPPPIHPTHTNINNHNPDTTAPIHPTHTNMAYGLLGFRV